MCMTFHSYIQVDWNGPVVEYALGYRMVMRSNPSVEKKLTEFLSNIYIWKYDKIN
jgi:hypothetical protein